VQLDGNNVVSLFSRRIDSYCSTDMRKDESDCVALIEKTANVLNDDVLKLLFVSVQQNNINLCAWYAVGGLFAHGKERTAESIVRDILVWYPHILEKENYESDRIPIIYRFKKLLASITEPCNTALIEHFSAQSQPNSLTTLQIAAATCICAEQTFSEVSASRDDFVSAFTTALSAYFGSGHGEGVNKEIGVLVERKDQLNSAAFRSELCRIIKNNRLRIHPV